MNRLGPADEVASDDVVPMPVEVVPGPVVMRRRRPAPLEERPPVGVRHHLRPFGLPHEPARGRVQPLPPMPGLRPRRRAAPIRRDRGDKVMGGRHTVRALSQEVWSVPTGGRKPSPLPRGHRAICELSRVLVSAASQLAQFDGHE